MTWHQPTLPYNSTIMDYSKRFVFTLTLVSKLCPEELVAKVRSRGTKSVSSPSLSLLPTAERDALFLSAGRVHHLHH